MLAVHARVVIAADDAQRRIALELRFLLDPIDALRKRDFVSARRPRRIRLQAEGERHGVFAPARLMGERQVIFAALHRRNVGCKRRGGDGFAVARQNHDAVIRARVGEHRAVGDDGLRIRHLGEDILVVVFDLLHLRAFLAVAIGDAVAAEVVIAGSSKSPP